MKQAFIKFTLLYLLLSLGVEIYAQVTFGHNTPPIIGALAQLKENNNLNGSETNSSKGLLMPRLSLIKKKLNGGSNVLSTIYLSPTSTWDASSHVGLVIYNTNTDKPEDLCPGLYTWKGSEWERLHQPCTPSSTSSKLNISDKELTFYNNIKTHPDYVNKNNQITVAWSSNNPVTVSSTGGISFVNGNTSLNPTSNKYTTYIPELNPIPQSDLDNATATYGGPFVVKESEITFTVDGSSEKVTVKQINKDFVATLDNTSNTIKIKTNSKLKVKNPLTNEESIIGEEKDTHGAHVDKSYPMFTNNDHRYSYVVISDFDDTNPRFPSQIITKENCNATKDLSAEDYMKIFEAMYGVTSPDSNGSGQNPRKVQWHRDRSGRIFYSAMFGNQRWMTSNVATTATPKYAQLVGWDGVTNVIFDNTYTYPNVRNQNITSTTLGTVQPYNTKTYYDWPRLGLLYNQKTAMGVCPDGWRVPSKRDYDTLINELKNNATTYRASYANPTANQDDYTATMREVCKDGKSKSFMEGGFDMLMSGFNRSVQGNTFKPQQFYGVAAYFWTTEWVNPANYEAGMMGTWLDNFYLNYPTTPSITSPLVFGSGHTETQAPIRCLKD